jgi:hypothetical protein
VKLVLKQLVNLAQQHKKIGAAIVKKEVSSILEFVMINAQQVLLQKERPVNLAQKAALYAKMVSVKLAQEECLLKMENVFLLVEKAIVKLKENVFLAQIVIVSYVNQQINAKVAYHLLS